MTEDQWATRISLLEKIKDRYDDDAWEDFVYYYQQYIYNMLRRMHMTDSEAEESCQKIIVKLWDKLPDFEYQKGIGKFRTWLCRIITNHVRNIVRHNKVKLKHQEYVHNELKVTSGEPFSEAEVAKIAEQEWAVYVSNLAWKNLEPQLSEKNKEIFIMHTNGKSSEEIATALELNYNTVNVYKMRVKDQLIREIQRLTDQLI
ncbi:MAG: RNA polymerase sigma factor [Lentisphaerales bacterium]|nr:RNA polymerase sigma factor [Lentisphaerales bacterium]